MDLQFLNFLMLKAFLCRAKASTSSWKKYLFFGTCSFCAVLYLDNYLSFTVVSGPSMQPTINPLNSTSNDIVLLDRRASWNYSKVQRGDVITYRSPRNPNDINIKRVIGLEGDTVTTIGYRKRFVKVPVGHCWVEGDNHARSEDSNVTGPVPLGLVQGRATHIIYPPRRWGRLEQRFPHARVQLSDNCDPESVSPPSFEPSVEEVASAHWSDGVNRSALTTSQLDLHRSPK